MSKTGERSEGRGANGLIGLSCEQKATCGQHKHFQVVQTRAFISFPALQPLCLLLLCLNRSLQWVERSVSSVLLFVWAFLGVFGCSVFVDTE